MLGLVSYESSSEDEAEVREVKTSSKVSALSFKCYASYITNFVQRQQIEMETWQFKIRRP